MDPPPTPFFYHPSISETSTPTSSLDKEHMFEKPLTPSDVGKLNRLVIPKQHAEKYLPLSSPSPSASGGLLLGFEDESGKCWRFRYSYWNSSQSYVLTKGWSRFVKEKKLDAGDVVLFDRHRFQPDRLYIGWRRRPSNTTPVQTPRLSYNFNYGVYNNNVVQSHQISAFHNFATDSIHPGRVQVRQESKKSAASGNSKRLRLFGVNLECQLHHDDQDPHTSDGSSPSSHGQAQDLSSGSITGPTSYNHFAYLGYPPNHT